MAHIRREGEEGIELCVVCQGATKESVGQKKEEGNPFPPTTLLTLFKIQASLIFSDICFHGPKRFIFFFFYERKSLY